jgi:adenylate cyclase
MRNPQEALAMNLDDPVARRIVGLHVWAVREGLRGTEPTTLFAGLCRRLVDAGVPIWRAFAGARTLHPQWAGYSYTWWRDSDAVTPAQFSRGATYERLIADSVFGYLRRDSAVPDPDGDPGLSLRRRLTGPEAQLDHPFLAELATEGATDYFAETVALGLEEASRGGRIGYSFATDQAQGFRDDDIRLLRAVLPVVSLALTAYAGHSIAAGLLGAYLGHDAGRRVHQGAVERGSVETIRAVVWNADIRGFTSITDAMPGTAVIELLDEVFETLAAPLRARGAQILKFLGDGMLAIFPFDDSRRQETCRQSLDAAIEATAAIDRMNTLRGAAGKQGATVDLALHLGEVMYGNVGAIDRLDFTVIGPAVNEVARIEALCEPLGRNVLVSAELAAAAGQDHRLVPLGRHSLRGVRDAREILGLRTGLLNVSQMQLTPST